MKKATGTRTVTTVNIAKYSTGTESASRVWTEYEKEGLESTLDAMIRSYREDDLDARGYHRPAEVSEYEFPGQRVIVFMYDGEVNTVVTVEDDLASALHTAVRKQRPVTVSYTKADGTDTVRTVEPRDVVATTAGSLIVRGIDRESEGTRSFRLDRISAYTVHRSRFTVRTPAPAPRKTDLVAAFRLGSPRPAFTGPAARVQSVTEGFKGRTLPETRGQGPSGWTVKVRLEDPWTGLTPSGTVRVPEADLIRL